MMPPTTMGPPSNMPPGTGGVFYPGGPPGPPQDYNSNPPQLYGMGGINPATPNMMPPQGGGDMSQMQGQGQGQQRQPAYGSALFPGPQNWGGDGGGGSTKDPNQEESGGNFANSLPLINEMDLTCECNPIFMQSTVAKVVVSQSAATASKIPIAIVVKPMAGDKGTGNDLVDVVDFGNTGIIRCKRCRTYINPYVTWTDNGRRWKCNICGMLNDVPTSYFSHLDNNGQRRDKDQRSVTYIHHSVRHSSSFIPPPSLSPSPSSPSLPNVSSPPLPRLPPFHLSFPFSSTSYPFYSPTLFLPLLPLSHRSRPLSHPFLPSSLSPFPQTRAVP